MSSSPLLEIRHDWGIGEIEAIYNLPLPELLFRSQAVHHGFHQPNEVQGCVLLSVKTGGCPEDCAYCPQSAHYETGLRRELLVEVCDVLAAAEGGPIGKERLDSAWERRGDKFPTVRTLTAFCKWSGAFVPLDWKPAALWACSQQDKPLRSQQPGSRPTIITWILHRSFTAKSSQPGSMRIDWKPCSGYGKPGLRSAAEESLEWAKVAKTAIACSNN